jgi:hypothetical protein
MFDFTVFLQQDNTSITQQWENGGNPKKEQMK